jgi:hypothetical protein
MESWTTRHEDVARAVGRVYSRIHVYSYIWSVYEVGHSVHVSYMIVSYMSYVMIYATELLSRYIFCGPLVLRRQTRPISVMFVFTKKKKRRSAGPKNRLERRVYSREKRGPFWPTAKNRHIPSPTKSMTALLAKGRAPPRFLQHGAAEVHRHERPPEKRPKRLQESGKKRIRIPSPILKTLY